MAYRHVIYQIEAQELAVILICFLCCCKTYSSKKRYNFYSTYEAKRMKCEFWTYFYHFCFKVGKTIYILIAHFNIYQIMFVSHQNLESTKSKLTRERLKVPDADFDQTLHICRKSKVIKNCEIIAALSEPFLRYGTTKFFSTPLSHNAKW